MMFLDWIKRPWIQNAIKVIITVVGLYWAFVSAKLDLRQLWQSIQSIPWYMIGLLLGVVNLGVLVSATRLYYILNKYKMPWSWSQNLRWYYWGMFLNFFTPAGVGGDAYKGVYMVRHFKTQSKLAFSTLFVDRFMGLAALFLWMFACLIIGQSFWHWPHKTYWIYAFWGLGILVIPVTYTIVYVFFRPVITMFFRLLWLSLTIQGLQLVLVFCILTIMGVTSHHITPYLSLYLLSSLLTILPITLGGVGIRELTFSNPQIIHWVDINPQLGIGMTLLIFALVLLSSLIGTLAYWMGQSKLSSTR